MRAAARHRPSHRAERARSSASSLLHPPPPSIGPTGGIRVAEVLEGALQGEVSFSRLVIVAVQFLADRAAELLALEPGVLQPRAAEMDVGDVAVGEIDLLEPGVCEKGVAEVGPPEAGPPQVGAPEFARPEG